MDTKLHELQYQLLRCLATNSFLGEIGIITSLACSFCGEMSESSEHLFISCHYSTNVWAEDIKWLDNQEVKSHSPLQPREGRHKVEIKVLCEQTREANKRIQIFFLDYV